MTDFRKLDVAIASDEVIPLADKIGIHYTTLYRILRGDTDPSYLVGLALAENCHTTLDALAGRRGGQPFSVGTEHPFDALRKAAEMTTRAFAAKIESNIGYIHAVKTLVKTPSCKFVDRVAHAFGVRAHDLARALRAWDSAHRQK